MWFSFFLLVNVLESVMNVLSGVVLGLLVRVCNVSELVRFVVVSVSVFCSY